MKLAKQSLFVGLPTRDQAKRIFWDDLKELALPVTVDKSESELWIKTITGSEIWVLGFDKPERFEGKRWNGGILDEFANMKESTWNENVMPALRDTKGWAWLIGVPEGKNHYYELSEYAKSGIDPEWEDYSWLSQDVMDEAEVMKEMARLDERTFRQEYCGSFESYEGRAYVYYDEKTHRKIQPFNEKYPLCISCDFNLDPSIWVMLQNKDGFISIQQELKQKQTDIWKMAIELKRRIKQTVGEQREKTFPIYFYGDFEHGQTRSLSATATSWQVIRNEFAGYNVQFRLKGHPAIVDRINAVNSKMRSADGKVNFGLDPQCVESHKDFEMVSSDMLTSQTAKSNAGDRTHASDNIGYFTDYEFPIRKLIVQSR